MRAQQYPVANPTSMRNQFGVCAQAKKSRAQRRCLIGAGGNRLQAVHEECIQQVLLKQSPGTVGEESDDRTLHIQNAQRVQQDARCQQQQRDECKGGQEDGETGSRS